MKAVADVADLTAWKHVDRWLESCVELSRDATAPNIQENTTKIAAHSCAK